MSDPVIIASIVATTLMILSWMFKEPLTRIMDRSERFDFKLNKEGVNTTFRTGAQALERDTSAEIAALESSMPGELKPADSQLALPTGSSESTNPSSNDAQARQLVAIGVDWGALIVAAQNLLAQSDIPAPEENARLDQFLTAFDTEMPGILPARTLKAAADAEKLLLQLMNARQDELSSEDIELFSKSLSSLHRIVNKSASKARHPSSKARHPSQRPERLLQ